MTLGFDCILIRWSMKTRNIQFEDRILKISRRFNKRWHHPFDIYCQEQNARVTAPKTPNIKSTPGWLCLRPIAELLSSPDPPSDELSSSSVMGAMLALTAGLNNLLTKSELLQEEPSCDNNPLCTSQSARVV
ncbi:hypothetical protein RRF57_006046 [Xylaria bambusicola]|uniref:Uncharacterized protein n=1 Tax=Xylaria bambusicola TaxID=326684 RepID=A0AAN7UPK6_9PEZI